MTLSLKVSRVAGSHIHVIVSVEGSARGMLYFHPKEFEAWLEVWSREQRAEKPAFEIEIDAAEYDNSSLGRFHDGDTKKTRGKK